MVILKAGLQTVNEVLRGQICKLKEQLEREKQVSAAAHKAKVCSKHNFTAYGYLDPLPDY